MSPSPRTVSSRRSEATQRAYRSDWAAFESWCVLAERASMPATPDTVLAYVRSLVDQVKLSTLRRKLAAIHTMLADSGHELPARWKPLLELLAEVARRRDARPSARPSPSSDEMARMIRALPESLCGVRDRALLLVGWAISCRPADLIALEIEGISWSPRQAELRMKQRGGGTLKVVLLAEHEPELCPVRWLKAWLRILGVKDGAVFRPVTRYGRVGTGHLSVQMFRIVLRRAALAAGVPVENVSADGLCAMQPAARRTA